MSNFEELQYTKSQVKRAGKIYISTSCSDQEKEEALKIINNWRASHSFPMQVIYMHLREISPDGAIVAQRLKRLHSITHKLSRFPNMSLTSMQDIGGCRIIVNTLSEVDNMVARLKKSRMRHKLKEEYDYVKTPKTDGYRCYHMVYSYFSDRNPKYNGLFIEIQIRTHIQHMWATAVETMDTFTGDPLKLGQGSEENREFFVRASKLLQLYEETNGEWGKIKGSKELENFVDFNGRFQILEKLISIKKAAEYVQNDDAKGQGYYLMILNRDTGTLNVSSYSKKKLEQATEAYDELEKMKGESEDVVLVSTVSFNTLKQAYPNYFVDIQEFLTLMQRFTTLQ